MDSNSVIVVSESADMVTTILTQGVGALITGTFVLLAAYIAYKSGLKAYFTKREHEQIIKRYLDEGIDRVLVGVHHVSNIFNDNNLTAWTILHQVQENREADLSVEFKRFKRQHLELTSISKITNLVGDKIFAQLIGKLFGFIDGHTVYLKTKFLPTLVKIKSRQISGGDELKEMQSKLDVFRQQFNRYLLLVDELQQITSSLERQTTLNWSNIDQFKNRPEIRASVKRLKEKFEVEIQETLGQKQ
jgi:hypothetical protein